jgi:hypothetical protein
MKDGPMKDQQKTNHRGDQTIIGKLSGKTIVIPDVNAPLTPALEYFLEGLEGFLMEEAGPMP